MSTSYAAALIVGIRRQDALAAGVQDFTTWAENLGFDLTAPCYDDGGEDDAIAGLKVATTGGLREGITMESLGNCVPFAIAKVHELTGMVPKLYLTLDVG